MADTPPSQKFYIYHRYRFGRAQVGLAEARFSQHKSFFFVILPRFWKESAIFNAKINFLVKFCSRYTYSEVRATKNCEKTICAARTWPPRALPARAQIYM